MKTSRPLAPSRMSRIVAAGTGAATGFVEFSDMFPRSLKTRLASVRGRRQAAIEDYSIFVRRVAILWCSAIVPRRSNMSGVAANGACGMDVEGVVDMEGKTEFEPDCIADQSCSASESSVDGMVETVFAVAVVT